MSIKVMPQIQTPTQTHTHQQTVWPRIEMVGVNGAQLYWACTVTTTQQVNTLCVCIYFISYTELLQTLFKL